MSMAIPTANPWPAQRSDRRRGRPAGICMGTMGGRGFMGFRKVAAEWPGCLPCKGVGTRGINGVQALAELLGAAVADVVGEEGVGMGDFVPEMPATEPFVVGAEGFGD